MNSLLKKFTFSEELTDVIENCKGVSVPTSKAELYDMVFGPEHADVYDVVFDVPAKGLFMEAYVVRCKNGASVNFTEDYMRRREPDCMRIADDKPTDKKRFADVYGYKFDKLRQETMEWFKTQELILMPFNSGGNEYGYGSMLVCPKQCAFFAFALAHLQGFVNAEETEGYNPRAIVPRWDVPNIVKEPVEVDVRSFGVRMPPSTRDNPNYGIMGMLHIIPPALAWLWRLIAPRGFNNPSIVTGNELKSEGVGSYWPFATGKRVAQANLLLHQIVDSPNTRYVLIPNQHIGVYKVGFAAEWISREYLARHGGAKIRREHLEPARCPLLGYAMKDLTIDGQKIRSKFLRVDTQDRVGTDGYDAGAKILTDFFRKELAKFDTPELEPLGKQIIDCFMNGGTLEDFEKITPTGL